jgi:hypothetical protein
MDENLRDAGGYERHRRNRIIDAAEAFFAAGSGDRTFRMIHPVVSVAS